MDESKVSENVVNANETELDGVTGGVAGLSTAKNMASGTKAVYQFARENGKSKFGSTLASTIVGPLAGIKARVLNISGSQAIKDGLKAKTF